MKLERGDIGLTHGDAPISKAIREFETERGEGETLANHAFLVVDSGPELEAVIVEAVWPRVVRRSFSRYAGSSDLVAVYRPLTLTRAQIDAICAEVERHVGRPYNWSGILLQALDKPFGRRRVFRRLGFIRRYCSTLIDRGYHSAGFARPFGYLHPTPDDIHDWILEHPKDYAVARPWGRVVE